MRHSLPVFMMTALAAVCSCGDDEGYDEAYPAIVTEMADVATDSEGRMARMTTDAGTVYTISNPVGGYTPAAVYRLVCGYVPDGARATVYQMQGVRILRDSTAVARKDPTAVTSAWRGGRYINLQLEPLTQGGTHGWGFIVEREEPGHVYVSLHHNRRNDPPSYTRTEYASLPVDNLAGLEEGGLITLYVNTPKGEKEWNFRK